ncbi:lipocalin family protein [Brevundimonas vitis]|uniref:Outer membrane lipoprotein Blc n=1 Tax=Brevundimonas vitisensis TaxID=2800818 RepID=A0ABX7BPJ2_9CAUL|nr:lipocalin family protein [Brevundimonas vitisensis]QQQ17415.1 lipocalin family protein [Brevundimonas vitisensis]
MTPIRMSAVATAFGLALVAGPAAAQATNVNLGQFDGRWFEVVRSHNDVQKDCSRAQIDFNPTNRADRYGIVVTCTRRADGVVETLRANARVTDTTTNAKFRFSLTGLLSFGGLAGQNYWVWDHAPDYSWAIMGLPNKSDWWIWHRSQSPSEATRTQLIGRARALGFNTGNVVHTGR